MKSFIPSQTAERVARSALAQFDNAPTKLLRRGEISTAEQVRDLVQEAAGGESIILHTFVSDELRDVMLTEARMHDVDAMDVLGPVLDRFSTRLNLTPLERPGRSSQLAKITEQIVARYNEVRFGKSPLKKGEKEQLHKTIAALQK